MNLVDIIPIGLMIIVLGVVWMIASKIDTNALSPGDFCKSINGNSDYEINTSFSLIPNGRWYCLIEKEGIVKRKEVIYINNNWKIIK